MHTLKKKMSQLFWCQLHVHGSQQNEENGMARNATNGEQSLVQEGSRLQLRRLGVAGTKGHPWSQPQDPEAVPDFQIERERQSAGSSLARSRSRVELVRFSLFPYIHVIRVSARSAPFFRDRQCLPFCIPLI